MNYLLLGGAGFIGTHLAKKLLSLGHDVTIVDSCVTSHPPLYKVNFIQADIINYNIEPLVEQADIVYFLAGSVGVENVVSNPNATMKNNIGLVSKLIPIFEKYQKKVVFSSTSEVYGEGPFSETSHLSIGPSTDLRWSYAAAKLATEFMITTSTFPYVIVRFFNVTGPGQVGNYGMVLPRFVAAAKCGADITIYNSGSQIRSFFHVSNAVEALLTVEKLNNEVINIGNNDPITIKELAEKVIKLTNSDSKLNFVSVSHSDIQYRVPDVTKLLSIVSFERILTIDDIIRDMIDE